MPEHIIEPHTKDDNRQRAKREGADGKPGAGKIQHKGGAGSSHKATGGKNAR